VRGLVLALGILALLWCAACPPHRACDTLTPLPWLKCIEH
jgi:hypothetical protein